jgi:uncharacterized C2H2 Zn-finger protein
MADAKIPKKSPTIFSCELCDYITSNKKDYNKHILTRKHLIAYKCLQLGTNYMCEKCNTIFQHRQSLWRHKKKCINTDSNINNYNNISTIDNNIIMSLITQNQEFKDLIIEQNKHIIELSKDKSISNCLNTHNTTNNNNHFNLQLFLNERCKNALNMVEFVDQLKVTIDDLEATGRLGYAEGISRIFINGLKSLDVYERPIHCSDAKRETIYIKDENKWEKDDENKSNLEKAVRKVAQKNMRCITQWQKLHPNFNNTDARENDKYLHIVSNSMCGGSKEETTDNYNKIKKNIIKESIINKVAL